MIREAFPKPVILILLLAVAVRLYGTWVASTINIDGTLYINQAKAIYLGQGGELFCGLTFLPLNSLLLVPLYLATHNWIVAAKTLSLLCGVGSIVPIYLISRRFFEQRIATAILLLLSLIPVLVNSSVEIIKDPVAWVFFTFSLLSFIRYMENNTLPDLLLCSILFLCAGWARGEFFLLYFATALFLLLTQKSHRTRDLLLFLAPLLPIVLISYGYLEIFGIGSEHIRTPASFAPNITTHFITPYTALKTELYALIDTYPPNRGLLQNFLPEAANLAWLVGLGYIATRGCEAIFHPFVLFFLIGFCSIGSWTHNKMVRFLLWITSIAFLVVYLQTLRTWVLEPRWMGGMILSATIFAGIGIHRTDLFLQTKLKINKRTSIIAICIFLFLFGLIKNIDFSDRDKTSLQDIAATIEKYSQQQDIFLAGTASTEAPLYLVSFYANLKKPKAINPAANLILTENEFDSLPTLQAKLTTQGINYLLLAPAPPGTRLPLDRKALSGLGKCLGEWPHEALGPLVLYKVQ